MSHASLFGTLFWWRLRHVAEVAYRLVLRRWQAVIVIGLVLSPRDMPILQQLRILAHPVLVLTSPGSVVTVLATWVAMLSLAQTWARVQGDVVAGGPAWAHLRAQPLPPHLARRVDLAVLAVCDLPLFLPFAAALVVLPRAPLAHQLLQGAAVLVAAAQLPVLQWLAARRPANAAVLVVVQLAGLGALAVGLSALPFVAGAAVAATLALRRADAPAAPRRVRLAAAPRARTGGRAWPAATPTWLRLAGFGLRGLLDPRRVLRHLSLATCVVLPWLVLEYMGAYGAKREIVTGAVLLTLVPLVFSVSGLAFELRRMHEPMRALHASLGIGPRLLRRIDHGVLLALFSACVAPLLLAAWRSSGRTSVLWVLPLGASALMASVALNFRGDRGVLLPKAFASILAAGIAIQLITT